MFSKLEISLFFNLEGEATVDKNNRSFIDIWVQKEWPFSYNVPAEALMKAASEIRLNAKEIQTARDYLGDQGV